MASVERSPKGPGWRVRWRDGVGVQHAQHFRRRVDADRFRAQVEVDAARGLYVDPVAGRTTVGEWADRWMASTVHLKPKTRAAYTSLLRSRILPTFGKAQLARVRPIDVREWVAEMQAAGLSPSRIRQAAHVLSAVMEAAVEDGRIAVNPALKVKLPLLPETDATALTADEVHRLVAAMPQPYDVLVEVLAFGGLRFGEAVALRRGRCDLLRSRLLVAESLAEVNGRVIVGPTKTHQQGAVVLPGFVRDHLAAHLAQQNSDDLNGFVFTGPGGGPVRYSNFYRRVWRPALERTALPGVGVHTLRHTCASLLVAQGATVKALQAQLRHRDPALTLKVYSHLYGDEHDELARRLDAAYGSGVYPVCTEPSVTPLPQAPNAL